MKKTLQKLKKVIVVMALSCAMMLSPFAVAVPVAAEEADGGNQSNKRVIVTLGDSYSSGEGMNEYYGQFREDGTEKSAAEKVKDPDWIAHRSPKSWAAGLKLDGKPLVKGDNWYFVAATGATTKNLKNPQERKYAYHGQSGTATLPAQLDVFDYIDGQVAAVTVTIGGNDAGFADIIKVAVEDTLTKGNGLKAKIDKLTADLNNSDSEIQSNIRQAYKDICEAAGSAPVIVIGYPYLMYREAKEIPIYINNTTIARLTKEQIKQINSVYELLNRRMSNLISVLQKDGYENLTFLDMASSSRKHGLGSGAASYIGEIRIAPSLSEDYSSTLTAISSSLHLNEKGSELYTSKVQDKIDSLELSNRGTVFSDGRFMIGAVGVSAVLVVCAVVFYRKRKLQPNK